MYGWYHETALPFRQRSDWDTERYDFARPPDLSSGTGCASDEKKFVATFDDGSTAEIGLTEAAVRRIMSKPKSSAAADNLWDAVTAKTNHKIRAAIRYDRRHQGSFYEQGKQIMQVTVKQFNTGGEVLPYDRTTPDRPYDRPLEIATDLECVKAAVEWGKVVIMPYVAGDITLSKLKEHKDAEWKKLLKSVKQADVEAKAKKTSQKRKQRSKPKLQTKTRIRMKRHKKQRRKRRGARRGARRRARRHRMSRRAWFRISAQMHMRESHHFCVEIHSLEARCSRYQCLHAVASCRADSVSSRQWHRLSPNWRCAASTSPNFSGGAAT